MTNRAECASPFRKSWRRQRLGLRLACSSDRARRSVILGRPGQYPRARGEERAGKLQDARFGLRRLPPTHDSPDVS